MAKYANQKTIKINKVKLTDGAYFTSDWDTMANAMCELTFSAYKLWAYLSWNQEGFNLDLSPEDFVNEVGLAKATYYKCIKELEDLEYLIFVDGNMWLFNQAGKRGADEARKTANKIADNKIKKSMNRKDLLEQNRTSIDSIDSVKTMTKEEMKNALLYN